MDRGRAEASLRWPWLAFDVVAVIVAHLTVIVARFDGRVPEVYWERFWTAVPIVALTYLVANLIVRAYSPDTDLRWVVLAAFASASLVFVGVRVSNALVPASVVMVGGLATMLGFIGIRIASRPSGPGGGTA